MQECGAADRPADGVDDDPAHHVEHHRHHPAVHDVIAAHVISAELHADLNQFGIEAADLPRRHEQAAGSGQAGHPTGRGDAAGGPVRRQ